MIATDKTGTLTVNELTVREVRLPDGRIFEVGGEGFEPEGEVTIDGATILPERFPEIEELARAGVLCNEASLSRRDSNWEWRGDAVDIALLSFGHKVGQIREKALDRFPGAGEIPFESERQFAATFHYFDGKKVAIVKGAPERVFAMCDPESSMEGLEAPALAMAGKGLRVLAIAEGPSNVSDDRSPPEDPGGLRLLGLVGMIDPMRHGARKAVEDCHSAGVSVSMITGDHRVTALAIARELGMVNRESEVTTGQELETKSSDELRELVRTVRVFARVAPSQKLQIVEAMRSSGHFVAVTGDGVNDAPALRASNIGVAMGKAGTDVAREASELVISDDNFSTIVAGIEEGRVAYDNIRKVIYLLISTGAAELVLMGLAIFSGMPMPLLPVQLLWLNLVTNGIQDVALAFEPGEGDELKRKPRSPDEPVIDRLMIERIVIAAGVMGLVGFAAFREFLNSGWSEMEARNGLLLMMVLFENFHIGNCRSETKSAFAISPLRSPILLCGTIGTLALHIAAMHSPILSDVRECRPVSLITWVLLILCTMTIVPALEAHKYYWNRRLRSVKS
jgi:magnesium-transporting ATPase (P-type)